MGKFLFNDIFKEIVDSFDIDSTVLGNMTDRDASRIRHYKTDSKPGKSVLEQLINSICHIISETNDSYINSELIVKLNLLVNQNGLFPEHIRIRLSEIKDISTYLPFILRRSLELSSSPQGESSQFDTPIFDSNSIITKVTQAHQYFENNLYQDAITIFNEVLSSRKLSDLPAQNQLVHTDLGLIYRNSGLNQYNLDMIKLSIHHLDIASKISLDIGDLLNNAIINKYIGTVYMSLSNLEDAEANLKKAMKHYDIALGVLIDLNQEEYSRVMINYGNLFIHYSGIRNSRKILKNAISYLDKAIDYYKDTNNYFEGLTYLHCSSAYSLLAEISNTQENAKHAIAMVGNAMKIYTVEDYPLFYGQCLSNLAHIHLMMAEYGNTLDNCEIAISQINQALNIFAENIDTYSYFIAHLNLAAVYILLNNATKDCTYLDKAMECIGKCQKHRIKQDCSLNNIKINLSHAEVLINYGEVKKDPAFLIEAENIINEGLEISQEMKYDYLTGISEGLLAKLYLARYYITGDTNQLEEVLLHANISLEIFTIYDYPLYNASTSHLIAKAYRLRGDYERSKHEYEVILNIFTKEKYTEKNAAITEEYYDLCKEKGWQIILKLR